jgi:hypothetical protein
MFERAGNLEVSLRPMVPSGHKVEEVDAPENYANDLQAFCEKHSRKS